MNLVRVALIVALGGIAYYAMSIYAMLPPDTIALAPTRITEVQALCPSISNQFSGTGPILVALAAVAGAIGIAVADFRRRVY